MVGDHDEGVPEQISGVACGPFTVSTSSTDYFASVQGTHERDGVDYGI